MMMCVLCDMIAYTIVAYEYRVSYVIFDMSDVYSYDDVRFM